jgi:hypothetical protein
MPATLAATVVAAGSLLAPAPLHAQEVTILRGSAPPREPYAPVQDDNQSSNYSPSGYGDAYPYYGDDLPLGIGRGFHDRFHRRFNAGFHGRAFRGGFHRGFSGAFHGGSFHGGGSSGGGFHGGGGHR